MTKKMKKILNFICIALGVAFNAYAQDKPRVVILTDIGRPDLEPDDTESLVHLLCYADMLEIEGIITSTGWNCDSYPTESAAYRDSAMRENLAYSSHQWMPYSAKKINEAVAEAEAKLKYPQIYTQNEWHMAKFVVYLQFTRFLDK